MRASNAQQKIGRLLAVLLACLTLGMFLACTVMSSGPSHNHGTHSTMPQDHETHAAQHVHCSAGILPLVVLLPLLFVWAFSLPVLILHTSMHRFPPFIPPRSLLAVSFVTA